MANSYLSKTPNASNRRTMTFSVWIKRSRLGYGQPILTANTDISSDASGHFAFDADDTLHFRSWHGSAPYQMLTSTNRKFKDTTSWYHIVVAMDTTQATDTNRVKFYVNGVQETSLQHTSYPAQNYEGFWNSNILHNVGRGNDGGIQYHEGNMAHFHFVDGTALTPSTFGETDSTTGEWKPKLNPTGITYGTNGFFLKFEDPSSLGTDSSGNSNTWTVNGDLKQSVNTPSNVFCTLDTNQAYAPAQVHYGGTAYLGTSASADGCASTQMVKNGKWYFEVKLGTDRTTTDSATISIAKNGTHAQRRWRYAGGANAIVGKETGSNGCEGITYQPLTSTPNIIDDGGGGTVNYGTQASENDIIMVAVDLSNATTGKIWFGKNGTWFNAPGTSNVGNPATGANPGLSFAKGDDFWGINITAITNQANNDNRYMFCNFGEGRFGTTAVSSGNADGAGVGSFEYATSGFYAICTKNIKDYG